MFDKKSNERNGYEKKIVLLLESFRFRAKRSKIKTLKKEIETLSKGWL